MVTNSKNYDFSALNVMIVDDNRHMHHILKSILGAMRIKNVRTVNDPAEAFTEMRNWPIDIVITDLAMEPLDGLDFVRLVRKAKDSTNRHVPIILLTGHTEMYRVKEARDAGVSEILAKPISIEGLYNRIVSIVVNPRPFIKTKTYFGPDRRRQQRPFKGPDRRKNANTADTAMADAASDSVDQSAIDALFE